MDARFRHITCALLALPLAHLMRLILGKHDCRLKKSQALKGLMMSKGSRQRTTNAQAFGDNYDAIFGRKKPLLDEDGNPVTIMEDAYMAAIHTSMRRSIALNRASLGRVIHPLAVEDYRVTIPAAEFFSDPEVVAELKTYGQSMGSDDGENWQPAELPPEIAAQLEERVSLVNQLIVKSDKRGTEEMTYGVIGAPATIQNSGNLSKTCGNCRHWFVPNRGSNRCLNTSIIELIDSEGTIDFHTPTDFSCNRWKAKA